MPPEIAEKFENRFDLNSDTIKTNLYRKDNPNTYLAHFAEFIFTSERNGYFYKLLYEGISDFIHSRVLLYPQVTSVPVHFIGSIAYFSEDIIRAVVQPYGIKIGNIVRRPIDALIEYYRENVIKVS